MPRQLLVDDPIQFIGGGVRQPKPTNDLWACISNEIRPALRDMWTLTSGMASSSMKANADGPDNLAQRASSQSICEPNGDQILGPRVSCVAWYSEVP